MHEDPSCRLITDRWACLFLLQGSGGLVPRDADGDEAGEGDAEQADGKADAALKSGSRPARKARSKYRDTGAVDGGGPPGASDEVPSETLLYLCVVCWLINRICSASLPLQSVRTFAKGVMRVVRIGSSCNTLQDWQPAATQRPKRQRRRRGSPTAEEGSAEPDTHRRSSGSPEADDASPEAEADAAPMPTPARASKRQRKAAPVAPKASAAALQEPEEAAAAGVEAAMPSAAPLTEQQMAAAAAELAVRQTDAGRPQPGSLLLAQEPGNPARCASAFLCVACFVLKLCHCTLWCDSLRCREHPAKRPAAEPACRPGCMENEVLGNLVHQECQSRLSKLFLANVIVHLCCLSCRLWPVLVPGGAQLPVRVAGGGSQSCGGVSVLKPLTQASASGAVADAVPAVVLGSHAMGCGFQCPVEWKILVSAQSESPCLHVHCNALCFLCSSACVGVT